MDTQNTSRQLRYLEEVRIPLHRAGFETLPVEGEQLPVLWNGTPLCRITGKSSVFYRREDARYSYGRRLPGLQFDASLAVTSPLNLPAPGRCQAVYFIFRVRTALCFC